jgi:CDP-diacylglycerol--glycerol-3-phosphate 3-phosphatidyltransferase
MTTGTTTPPATAKPLPVPVFNLPNQLTSLRLLLAVVMFCMIPWGHYLTSLALFVIAASTDWLDGYFARKYGQVTTLGRILDPFADKVIICGTFIFLLAVPKMAATPYGVRAWMVVVIVGRELLVTALRSFIEDRGSDFSAKMSGKLKMLLQCIAAGAGLYFLSYTTHAAPGWVLWTMIASTWLAVLLTLYSGLQYVYAAARLLKEHRAECPT